MKKQLALETILNVGIVPVVRVASQKQAMLAVQAVSEGGIPIAEITMTVPGAVDLIRDLTRTLGSKVLVGAGTVLDAETAQKCIDSGASFLVSPNFDRLTVELAIAHDVVMMAGALTPTEVVDAWKAGADFVKIFPCGLVGGPRYLRALRGPLPHIRMVPTGGVNLSTAAEFIFSGAAALGIGGELISTAAIQAGDTTAIIDSARKYVEIVASAREHLRNTKTSTVGSVS